jgi:V8-like Glu-specific endopeptidase
MRIARSLLVSAVCGALSVSAFTGSAAAQTAPLESYQAPVRIDTGWIENTGKEPAVIFVTEIKAANAPWLRLAFDQAILSGSAATNNGSYLRLTSVFDGGQQVLDLTGLSQWNQTSAYFNGDTVVLELVAFPNTGRNRLVISEVTAGSGPALVVETICGPTDDRILSNDPRNARLMPIGCTAWLYENQNGCGNSFGTAGHCINSGTSNAVVQFNVPLSSSTGSPINPPPQDQYPVERASIQSNGGQGTGNDYAIFRSFKNSNTGLSPFEAQGDMYQVATTAANVRAGDPIRITGYGTTGSGVPRTWSQVQKTHVGPFDASASGTRLNYRTDTSGGNSGSPVIDENSGLVIGVHTHGGCTSGGGANAGTAVQHTGWQNFFANPNGTCFETGIAFAYPNGFPAMIDPAGGDVIQVNLESRGQKVPQSGSGVFHYNLGQGWVAIVMNEITTNKYEAVFPAVTCGETISYYFSGSDTAGVVYNDPGNAPAESFIVVAGASTITQTILDESLESGLPAGWSMDGLWGIGTSCAVGTSCDGGAFAYFGNTATCTYNIGARAVGSLKIAPMVLPSVPVGGALTLEFCYNLQTEANPIFDKATILVNGTQVDLLTSSATWTAHTVDLASYAGQSVVLEFKFDTTDGFSNNFRGFQVDGIKVTADVIDCSNCYADCDQSTGVGVLDVFDFLCFQNSFVAGNAYACDCDTSTGPGVCDVFDFLCFQNAFVAGCP